MFFGYFFIFGLRRAAPSVPCDPLLCRAILRRELEPCSKRDSGSIIPERGEFESRKRRDAAGTSRPRLPRGEDP